MADLYLGKHIPGTPAAAAAAALAATSGASVKAGTQQQAAKQQQQQHPQQLQETSKTAAAVAASMAGAAAVGTATPAAAPAAAVVAAVAAGAGDEAACGVHTPPQRSSDNDAPDSSSSQQPDAGGSPSSANAAAVVTAAQGLAGEGLGVPLQDASSGKLQQQQQLGDRAAAVAEADDTDSRDEGVAPAVEDSHLAAAAVEADDVLQDETAAGSLLDPTLTADGELPVGVVYAPVLDRSTWVSCASSSICATETGSIDGSAFALSEASLPVCASGRAAGYDSAEGMATLKQQQQQACGSPCSSPSGAGRSRFAAKLERLKESVKESVSIGGGSGSGGSSGSGGPAWKLPRAWVQQLRHGHEKEKDKEQQQQQQVSDEELEQEQQQQGVVVDQAVHVGNESGCGRVGDAGLEQQQGRECGVVATATSLTAAASH
jgi:hypothetical protein